MNKDTKSQRDDAMKEYVDEEMKSEMKRWRGSEKITNHISKENQVHWGGGGGPEIKIGENVLKHILVLEILKSNKMFEIGKNLL